MIGLNRKVGFITNHEKQRKDVLDAKEVKKMFEGSDHYVELDKKR